MPITKIKTLLDDKNIKYVMVKHSKAYTTQELAAAVHVSGYQIAKTVIVKVDGRLCMAVLPAPFQIDFENLKKAIGGKEVTLASEEEFKDKFPDCEVGAMPPFGNLYDMPVYVAEKLGYESIITFNAGTHTDLIQMAYEDFESFVKPKKVMFSK